ncbi:MAG TPA: hypothetical protein DIC60_05965 [Lachnospiraceae bacterium]|nr:hypothetical protein [Lachnospiraceae bacterium]
MDGVLNDEYHHGYYCAYGMVTNGNLSYHEYKITGPDTSNNKNYKYEVTYVGNNQYNVVVGGVIYKSFSGFAPGGQFMEIGLETNYSGSYWATNYSTEHKTKNGSGVWSAWPSGSIRVSDNLNTGYRSVWTTNPTAAKYYKP